MEYVVEWWIKGGSDLRTITGSDMLCSDVEPNVDQATAFLETSLPLFTTCFADEHYMIECGVWDYGVTKVVSIAELERQCLEEIRKEEKYMADLWKQAEYMHRTGMPKSLLKREKICPDCGGSLIVLYDGVHHPYYRCFECDAMLANKGDGHYFHCREW